MTTRTAPLGASAAHPAEDSPRIAVIVPCYNEGASIADVVRDFRQAIPECVVYVYDNNSQDQTREVASRAGAIVRHETRPGKGNVVRRMFADVDADIYVLVDGDGTYDAASAATMVRRMRADQLDMINARRVSTSKEAYRPGHRIGNAVLTKTVAFFFGDELTDLLSGYRVFSRRFAKSFPALSSGFEIETELTVHALELRMPIAEVATPYKERPAGSASKLHTFRDGFRILRTIALLVKEERPLAFFSLIAIACTLVSLVLAWPIVAEFVRTGLVARVPTAVLCTGLIISALLSLVCGLVLDTVTTGRRELKRMVYLGIHRPWGTQSRVDADRSHDL
jgi:hypothetical protein